MTIPQKVKLFFWRVLRGCLSVKSRLVQKESNEIIDAPTVIKSHCFFGCHTLREVWKEAKEWQVADKCSENVVGLLDMCIKMIDK
jgi:hypothetical protein